MTRKGGTGVLHNKGNKKGNPGHEGNSEGVRTPEDDALACRRFDEYVRITKTMEPGSYDNEDVIKVLPMDGGTKQSCGDTRFEHLMLEKCSSPANGPRCGKELKNSRLCARPIGHPSQCWSEEYRTRQRKLARERRQREGVDKRKR